MNNRPEYYIQCTIASYLDAIGVLWSASSNGMKLNIKTASMLKKAGYKKGFPDIVIFEPRGKYHGMTIEVKSDIGSPTPEQVSWANNLNNKGYYAIICPKQTNLNEQINWIIEKINKYLGEC
jgi:hypothetical protein